MSVHWNRAANRFTSVPLRTRTSPPRPPITVGALIPLSGAAGMWGPSCKTCIDLGIEEVNAAGGILGRPICLSLVDAGGPAEMVAERAATMQAVGLLDAVIGMHISATRLALQDVLRDKVPYVYAPLYEGGERQRGVFPIGETPNQQIRPAIEWFSTHRGSRRWYFVGNDYIWPHCSHAAARRFVHRTGGTVVGDEFVPLSADDYHGVVERIARAHPDAVVMSLVGNHLAQFNRAFAAAGLDRKILRFSPSMDENALLASGDGTTNDLYATAAYFEHLDLPSNLDFTERYKARFGQTAPVLNRFGALCYDGVHLLKKLAELGGGLAIDRMEAAASRMQFDSPRGRPVMNDGRVISAVYPARADGPTFVPVTGFGDMPP